ncbi:MAG: hypothetical protein M3O41_14260 [Pseudomonadota bacterium]|nr:hypothetical protein [Pseudomonadota bacterium]
MVDVSTLTNDLTVDGFVRHRCMCRSNSTLGAHGWENGRYCYKILFRDRSVTIYFGVFIVSCRDCHRRHRVRMLPKESRMEARVLRDTSIVDMQH